MIPSKVYLESTIPSYLTARASRDLVVLGQQEATRRWWEEARDRFDCHVSEFVEVEILQGDPAAAERRMEAIHGLPRLLAGGQVFTLVERLLATGLFPPRARMDAAHVAIATVHEMDFLLTWNCTHIHNVSHLRKIERVCAEAGHACPVICSPLELL